MNMTTGERMKQRRKEIGFSAEKVAERLGVSPATIYRYEKGDIEKVPVDSLAELAKILQTTPAYLMGWEEQPTPKPTSPAPIPPGFQPMPEMDMVPLVGRIACGTPITAEQNVERMVCVPSKWRSTFTLTCKGDSMEPRIHDGDLVAIRSQPNVENGEIAAVRIDGEATLKHVYLHDSFIELRPENPAFNSIILSREDMNNVVIEGKAVGLCRDI
nr:MAG TPA: Repressor protein CI [Caudoviricetes sp.]